MTYRHLQGIDEEQNDVTKLAYELILSRYIVNRDQVKAVLKDLSMLEYIVLYNISRPVEGEPPESVFERKTYLRELTDIMQRSTRKVSSVVSTLRDRGLVFWGHDLDGREGTYVTITQEGLELVRGQQKGLRAYFGRVIERFGASNVVRLLTLMRDLEQIMDEEFHENEEGDYDDEEEA